MLRDRLIKALIVLLGLAVVAGMVIGVMVVYNM